MQIRLNKKEILLVVLLTVALFLRMFMFSPVTVSGVSMEPTLYSGERGIILKHSTIQRGDIICFIGNKENEELFIKRVIGVEGDTIQLQANKVFVNGTELEEEYLIDYPWNSNYNVLQPETSFQVPAQMYFVMGDNRVNSLDSRKIGFVTEEDVWGKLVFSYGFKKY